MAKYDSTLPPVPAPEAGLPNPIQPPSVEPPAIARKVQPTMLAQTTMMQRPMRVERKRAKGRLKPTKIPIPKKAVGPRHSSMATSMRKRFEATTNRRVEIIPDNRSSSARPAAIGLSRALAAHQK